MLNSSAPTNTAGGTSLSSSSDLILPPGSTIVKAYLYIEGYAASLVAGTMKQMTSTKFKVQNNPYITLNTTTAGFLANPMSGSSYGQIIWDVTSLIPADGFTSTVTPGGNASNQGKYAIADVNPFVASNYGYGWCLIVIYSNPASKYRSVTVADACNTSSSTVTINNVIVPTIGTINACAMATGCYGDPGLTDYVKFGQTGTTLTSLIDPVTGAMDDAMNSTIGFHANNNISQDGGPTLSGSFTARNPYNTFNNAADGSYFYDLDVMNASGILPNSPTPISVTFNQASGGGDALGFGVYAISIDIAAARLSKSLAPTSIGTGGTATYTFKVANSHTGAINLTGINFSDNIPSGLQIANPNGVTITGGSGGVVTAAPGTNTFTLTNFAINGGTDAYITLNVTNKAGQLNPDCSTNPAAFTNSATNISGTTTNITNDVTPQCLIITSGPDCYWKADTVCLGNFTTFKDSSVVKGNGSIASWLWTFGDGQTSTTQNPQHNYAAAGNYTVKLKVTDSDGLSDSLTKVIVVKTSPALTIGPKQTICKGDSCQLSAGGGGTYAWTPNTALSDASIAQPKASPASTTTYTVRVTDPVSLCFRDSTQQVIVNNPVYAGTDGADSVCYGTNNVNLFALINNEQTGGKWIGPGVNQNTGVLNAGIAPVTAGTTVYKYVMTGTSPCPNDTALVTMKIHAQPTAVFPPVASFCAGTSAQMDVTFTGKAPFNLTYKENGLPNTIYGMVPGDQITINPSNSITTYQITSVSDGNTPTCTNNTISQITVNQFTPPKVTLDSVQCNSLNTQYRAFLSFSGGDAGSYELNGQKMGASKFTTTYINSGTPYNFSLTDDNNCQPISVISGNKVCNCSTDAGTMDPFIILTCGNTPVSANNKGDHKFDGNDVMIFVLHDGAGKALGNIIAVNKNSATFTYDSAWGIQYDKKYYISAVVGDPTAADPKMVDLSNPNGCLSVAKGQPVIFQQLPNLTATMDYAQICLGDTANMVFTFTAGREGYILTLSNGTTLPNRSNTNNLSPFSPTAIGTYTNTITQVRDTNGCISQLNIPLSFKVVDSPDTANVKVTCNNINTAYTVSFDMFSGDTASYQINGTPVGGSTSYTSTAINSGTSYNFSLQDVNNCKQTIISGSMLCPCISDAGTMTINNGPPAEFCEYSLASATHNGDQVFDGNDVLSYLLCTNPNNPFLSWVKHSKTPVFDTSKTTIGVTYYIVPVVGDDDGSGLVNLASGCLDYSAGTPIKFIAVPTVKMSGSKEICQGDSATITFVITGNGIVKFTMTGTDGSSQPLSFAPGTRTIKVGPGITTGSVTYTVDTTSIVDSTQPVNCSGNFIPPSVTITVRPTPIANISGNFTICQGEQISLPIATTGESTLTTVWAKTTGQTTDSTFTELAGTYNKLITSSLPAGTHNFVVKSIKDNTAANCPGTVSGQATVLVQPTPGTTFSLVNDTICKGDSTQIEFVTSGNPQFNIYYHDNFGTKYSHLKVGTGSNQFVIKPSSSRNYIIDSITDGTLSDASARSCFKTYSTNNQLPIKVITLPTGTLSGNQEICFGESAYIRFTLTGSFDVTATYDVINNETGATSSKQLITGNAKDSVLVTPGDTTTYRLIKVVDKYGCIATNAGGTAYIPVNPIPVPIVAASDSASCPPLITTLNNLTDQSYLGNWVWHYGNGTTATGTGADPGSSKTYEDAGSYDIRLEITSPQGCYKDTVLEKFLTVHPFPIAQFNWTPEDASTIDPQVRFNNLSTDNSENFWEFYTSSGVLLGTSDKTNPLYKFPDQDSGTYPVRLLVTTDFGCQDSIEHTVRINGIFEVYVPNTFSPNEDGVNDIFKPVMLGEEPTSYELTVYDRWGELIFTSKDHRHGWDGSFNGEQCKQDSYAYHIKVRSKYNAEKKDYLGTVRILR